MSIREYVTVDLVGHLTEGPKPRLGSPNCRGWVIVAKPTNSPAFRVVAPVAMWDGIKLNDYIRVTGPLRIAVTATTYESVIDAKTITKVTP